MITIYDLRQFVINTEPVTGGFIVQKELLYQLLCCANAHLSRPVAEAITRQEREGPIWNGQVIREYY